MIRYTLDGSEPDEHSALYESPVRITRSGVIKAKAFKEGLAPSPALVLKAVKADYIRAAKSAPDETMRHGVAYSLHEGKFCDADAVAATRPADAGVMPVPSITSAPYEDHYGYVFSGFVDIPERGVWEFMTKSDDGSILYIDGKKVVDNDGSHAAVSATGRIALDKGLHPFRLLYFEDYEGQELSWRWKAPGENTFSDIPEDRLYH